MESNDIPPLQAFTHIRERDSAVKPFDPARIASAMQRAAHRLTDNAVLPALAALGTATPGVEQVQDAVERALFEAGHRATLRACIAYREQHHGRRRDRKKPDRRRSVGE